MALTIRKKLAPFWFKLDDADPASAEFHLRPLSEMEFIDVQNEASFARNRLTLSAAGIRSALAYGLLGWKSVQDEDGKDLAFTLADAERLPKDVLRQLATKIVSVSLLSADEKKT